MSIPPERAAQIHHELDAIQAQHNVTVLFAVESGSRAWGFESKDSDFDCRYVFVRPPNRYLRVFPGRDVIENGDISQSDPLLDFSGWDLIKWLQLATKSNPAVFEWLASPLVYHEDICWGEMRELLRPFYSPRAAAHHYLSMARHNYREHMRDGAAAAVRLKKYLYICRPLLCLRWIEVNGMQPAPMAMSELLVETLPRDPVSAALSVLIDRKRAGEELDEGKPMPELNAFIGAELTRWEANGRMLAKSLSEGSGDVALLDQWFCQRVLHGLVDAHYVS